VPISTLKMIQSITPLNIKKVHKIKQVKELDNESKESIRRHRERRL